MVYTVLITMHVLVSILLVVLVLLQQGKGADAGAAFGSGGAGTVFGSRGPANFLTRATAILATLFFVVSLGLAYLTTQTIERTSVVERVGAIEQSTDPLSDVPASPTDTPASDGSDADVPAAPPPGETAQ